MGERKKTVRLCIISDTHGLHDIIEKKFGELPDADILIHAGDVSNIGEPWDIERFLNWFSSRPHKTKVFTVGNHDFFFETNRYICDKMIKEVQEKGWDLHYLQDEGKEIMGLKFWGSPQTPPFFNWAFNMKDEHRAMLYETIPDDVDILITHGPPKDILDLSIYNNEHVGCPYLRTNVFRVKPIVHIMGHIHHSYGVKVENDIMFINASTLNERYQVANKPIVVNIDIEKRIATLGI
jgi:Icc-related predicted phosphoesterase